jgi:probable F420-dependent oxidoreductase
MGPTSRLSMTTPFRFGVQLSGLASAPTWRNRARQIEDLGYSCATMPDHFTPQLAPIPALQAIADATTTLRVGALVFDNDYKHPVVLAKELATMDLLSEGRVEAGLGAGWMATDYQQSGIPYDPPKVRVDRFEEAIAVLKGCFAPGPFSFEGDHYQIANYDATPKPIQALGPPLLIGGGGPRVLRIAAREADIIGINATLTAGEVGPEAFATMTAQAVDEKVAIVTAEAGNRMTDIEMNIRVFMTSITDDREATVAGISSMLSVDHEMIAQSPFALIGSIDHIVETLLARRERWGFSYIIIGEENIEDFSPVVARLSGI